jgi:hypothetical protein
MILLGGKGMAENLFVCVCGKYSDVRGTLLMKAGGCPNLMTTNSDYSSDFSGTVFPSIIRE